MHITCKAGALGTHPRPSTRVSIQKHARKCATFSLARMLSRGRKCGEVFQNRSTRSRPVLRIGALVLALACMRTQVRTRVPAQARGREHACKRTQHPSYSGFTSPLFLLVSSFANFSVSTEIVCLIGVHLAGRMSAQRAIGMYVIIKHGNVNM